MELKRRFPFRLGTTSYILPADIVTNVKFLAGRADDVELLFFESEEKADLPAPAVIDTLRDIADGNGLTYTVHLPLDLHLGDADPAVRRASVEQCLRIVERTAPLAPFGFILHCNKRGDRDESEGRWLDAVSSSIDGLLGGGIDPVDVCIETIDYPFDAIEPVVVEKGLSVCIDIGHLALYRHPVERYLDRYLERSRVIHLHGVRDGRDHCDLSVIDRRFLQRLFSRLGSDDKTNRVVTIEVFNETALNSSLAVMEEFAV